MPREENTCKECSRRTPNRELMPPWGTPFTYCQMLWYVADRLQREEVGERSSVGWEAARQQIGLTDLKKERRCHMSYSKLCQHNGFVKVWLIKQNAPEYNAALLQLFSFVCVLSRLFLFASHIDFWKPAWSITTIENSIRLLSWIIAKGIFIHTRNLFLSAFLSNITKKDIIEKSLQSQFL